jgi:hypothetical protein
MIVLKPSGLRTGKNNHHEIAALLRRGKQEGFNDFRPVIFPLSSLKAVMSAQLRARIVEVSKVNFEKYRIEGYGMLLSDLFYKTRLKIVLQIL